MPIEVSDLFKHGLHFIDWIILTAYVLVMIGKGYYCPAFRRHESQ